MTRSATFKPQVLCKTTEGLVCINAQGRNYVHGKKYSVAKKLEAIHLYRTITDNERKCTVRALSKAAGISIGLASKYIKEYNSLGGYIEEMKLGGKKEKPKKRSFGTRTFDDFDTFVLLFLRQINPKQTLCDYKNSLKLLTGTDCSTSLISAWFNHTMPFKGSTTKASEVSRDKFTPENMNRFLTYKGIAKRIDPKRLKFGDKKHFRGINLFARKVRQNPLTGEVEPVIVDSDFQFTHSITGICGIAGRHPFDYYIHDGSNDAATFRECLLCSIQKGFLVHGDVLVLDNPAIHQSKENYDLEENLYTEYGILLLFLPTRSPELNPVEVLWNTLLHRMKQVPIRYSTNPESCQDAAPLAACSSIMENFTFDDVCNAFQMRHTSQKPRTM